MDADIVAPYGGVFCFSGGLPQFVSMMRETGLYMADETSEREAPEDSFSRTKEKSAPHNLIVNMALLQSQHADRGGAGAMFTYSEYVSESEKTIPDPKTPEEIKEFRIYLATLQTGTPTTNVTIKYPMATSFWAGDGAGQTTRSIWLQYAQRAETGFPRPEGLIELAGERSETENGFFAEANITTLPIWHESETEEKFTLDDWKQGLRL
jgi:hypothetical protein